MRGGQSTAMASAIEDDHRPLVALENRPHKESRETEQVRLLEASQQPRPTSSRRKRPIDHAYDSMRAYSEPPRPQSLSNNLYNASFLPPPNREPPLAPLKPLYVQPHPQRQAPPPPIIVQSQMPPMTIQKSHGKAKLNLLNPMSLLARRRSSQSVEEEEYSLNQNAPRMPDDYDPRIRGKVVHDFSAPRQGRPLSSPGINLDMTLAKLKGVSPKRNSASNQEDDSCSSVEREYIPVFKENFDDDVEPWSSDMDSPAKRRSSAFLYQVSLQTSQAPSHLSLPAFARKLPSNFSNERDALRKSSSPPPKALLTVLHETPIPIQNLKTSRPTSPPNTRSRSASITDPAFTNPSSPQRFKSNASRFSFDLAGVGSAAQEKWLEEKHREKAKRDRHESFLSDGDDIDADVAYNDYNDMEDDGLEEKIPGVNADDEDCDMPVLQHAMDNVNFISPNKSSFDSIASPVSTSLTSPGTPRDSHEKSVGLTALKSPPYLSQVELKQHQSLSKTKSLRPRSTPDGSTDLGLKAQSLQREVASETNLAGLPSRYECQDDDMYFDDGMIAALDNGDYQAFDETVFDDDASGVYGLPLRDLKPMPKAQDRELSASGPVLDPELFLQDNVAHENETLDFSHPGSSEDAHARTGTKYSVAKPNQPSQARPINHTAGLTQDNLGLHERLAFAANQAALEGKFNRTNSQDSTHKSHEGPNTSIGTTTQANQLTGLLIHRMENDNDDFAFDDINMAFTEAEDDDPIIAAANAEALENDDDGFYGQEFGFFARQPGSSESEYVNGGYFGSRAIEGIHRMNSGRDNFQEPSLTPITERSEWSNRNSMVSLAMHGYPLSAQYQSNPQLADLMRVQEGEEMSLEGLRKLRRDAWEGSNGSLQSGSNSQSGGSPRTYWAPGMVAPLMQATNSNGSLMSPSSQNLAGSYQSFSSGGHVSSDDSNPSPSAESPTITLSTSQSGLMIQQPMGPPLPLPLPPATDSSNRRLSTVDLKPWVPGHSRTSSGAESVSYREENGMWLCERTRVIEETGEIEILGRSVVAGGRI